MLQRLWTLVLAVALLALAQGPAWANPCEVRVLPRSDFQRAAGYPVTFSMFPIRIDGQRPVERKLTLGRAANIRAKPGDYVLIIRSRGHRDVLKAFKHVCSPPRGFTVGFDLEWITPRVHTARVRLPFTRGVTEVSFIVRNSRAIAFGDVDLGPARPLLQSNGRVVDLTGYNGREPAPPRRSQVLKRSGNTRTIGQQLSVTTHEDLLWPNGILPYTISPDFTASERRVILDSMRDIEFETNIRFRERQVGEDYDYARIIKKSPFPGECGSSMVGRQANGQDVVIRSNCVTMRVVQHELLHALGFHHEHQRDDRDQHVRITSMDTPVDYETNYEQLPLDESQNLGAYDYASVMHYRSSGEPDALIECINPACMGRPLGGSRLSALDRKGLLKAYPGVLDYVGGSEWGNVNSAVDIALGDITGDGNGEVIVVRDTKTTGFSRLLIREHGNDMKYIRGDWDDQRGWGPNSYATSVAVGQADDTERLEFVVGRRSTVNARAMLFRYRPHASGDPDRGRVEVAQSFGTRWPSSVQVRDVAFADIDGDGIDEMALVTSKSALTVQEQASETNPDALMVYKKFAADQPYRLVYDVNGVMPGASLSRVAMGDMDADGRPEIAVATTRTTAGAARYYILKASTRMRADRVVRLKWAFAGGTGWGPNTQATDVAIGHLPLDNGRSVHHILAVSRKTTVNARVEFVVNNNAHVINPDIVTEAFRPFIQEHGVGNGWSRNTYANSVAFADLDGDGDEELLVGAATRVPAQTPRLSVYHVLSNSGHLGLILQNRHELREMQNVTAIAAGDLNGNGQKEVGVANNKLVIPVLAGGGGRSGGGTTERYWAKRYAIYDLAEPARTAGRNSRPPSPD